MLRYCKVIGLNVDIVVAFPPLSWEFVACIQIERPNLVLTSKNSWVTSVNVWLFTNTNMNSRPLLTLRKRIDPILKILLVLLILQRYFINCVWRVPFAAGWWSLRLLFAGARRRLTRHYWLIICNCCDLASFSYTDISLSELLTSILFSFPFGRSLLPNSISFLLSLLLFLFPLLLFLQFLFSQLFLC